MYGNHFQAVKNNYCPKYYSTHSVIFVFCYPLQGIGSLIVKPDYPHYLETYKHFVKRYRKKTWTITRYF